ncbi:hypothetical protein ACQPTN_15095 [Bradyrhizobium sp. 13971]
MKYPLVGFQVSPSTTDLNSVPRVASERYDSDLLNKSVGTTRPYGKRLLDHTIDDSARAFFDTKVAEWLADTRWQSSMSVITAHPAFAEIKSLGDRAVRFVLERMQRGSVHLQWFPLLYDLAGVDPVPPHERGFVPQMTAAWLRWGQQTGRI